VRTIFFIGSFLLGTSIFAGEPIDAEIDQLSKQIEQKRLEIMNGEVESEKYIKGNWEKYTETIERVEKNEQELEVLKKRLKERQGQQKTNE
jgi:DNA topoisomerase IA